MKKNNILLIISSLLMIYTIIGFVAIPKLLKPQIQKILNENLTQKTSLEKIEFNPFLLKFTAYNLKIFDEKETTISLDKLLIDFSILKSIDEQHIAFKNIHVVNPYINIIENEHGTFNLQKLVKQKDTKKEEKKDKEESKSNIKFQIYKTFLDNAKIKFTKLIPNQKPFKVDINKLDYTFYDIGTFRNVLASHNLNILINKNTKLSIKGGLRLDPFKMYGNIKLNNFKPSQFARYKQDMLNFDLNEKTNLNIKLGYNIQMLEELKLKINNGNLQVNEFAIKQKENSLFSFNNFNINNLNLAYPQNNLSIESVLLNKLNTSPIINKNGILNFSTLVNSTNKEKSKTIKKESKAKKDSNTWKVSLKKFALKNSNVNFKELSKQISVDTKNINLNLNNFILDGKNIKVTSLDLSKTTTNFKDSKNKLNLQNKDLKVKIKDLSFKDSIANINSISIKNNGINLKDLKNSLNINSSGINITAKTLKKQKELITLNSLNLYMPTIQINDKTNKLKILTKSLAMNLNNLDLNNADLKLKKAKLKVPSAKVNDLKNKIDISTKNINLIATNTSFIKERLKISYLNLTKPTVSMIDKKGDKSILAKNISVKINGINQYKDSLYISKVNLHKPIITINDKKGKTNIVAKNIYATINKISNRKDNLKIANSSINKPNISITLGKKEKKEEVKPQEQVKKETKKKSNFKFDIGPVKINDMKMTFEDKNLPIPFKTDITNLNGKFSRLHSSSSKPTKLLLEGKVDEYGYTKITGTVDINDIKLLTDTNLLFKNIAIKNFTPYSSKFVGREIDGGKLNLDLKYNIKKSDLNAQNSVIIDKIKLGKNIESSDAANLPLELAIALLEDSDGVIDIDLPITGNVDDPQFSIAPIVWKAFFNLITKAITSPFALLGSILGVDSEELKSLEFEFGKNNIIASEKESLDNISKILSKKPKLAIKITPIYNLLKDKTALQDIKFNQFLTKQMKKIPQGDEYKKALEKLYKELKDIKKLEDVKKSFTKVDKDGKKSFDNEDYVESLRKILASKQIVSEDELKQLAMQRVENIQNYLLVEKKVSKDSIVIDDIKTQKDDKSKWAIFKLDVISK